MEPLSTGKAFIAGKRPTTDKLRGSLNRRQLLGLTTLGATAFGATHWMTPLATLLAREAESREQPPRSVILLWLDGGPSQLETFDPQPGAPIAGTAGAIDTSVSGVQIASWLPRVAEQMHSLSLVRSLVSPEGDHNRGAYLARTGYRPNATMVHPSIGAICCHDLPAGNAEIPRHVSITPGEWPGRGGFLGAQYDAFLTGDPVSEVPDLHRQVDPARHRQRVEDIRVVDRQFARGRVLDDSLRQRQQTIQRALTMMDSAQVAAFDVAKEPAAMRDAYGDHPFGRGCLAARRLIEVGVRCVEVTLGGWDSHQDNHSAHQALTAVLDPALATLITDLRERELLDHTLVLCLGEFGRTPRINAIDGRDHWTRGFSAALAGGGIRGGRVIGETDPNGGREPSDPRPFHDLHATVLTALGIDLAREGIAPPGRPIKRSEGTPIGELLADESERLG